MTILSLDGVFITKKGEFGFSHQKWLKFNFVFWPKFESFYLIFSKIIWIFAPKIVKIQFWFFVSMYIIFTPEFSFLWQTPSRGNFRLRLKLKLIFPYCVFCYQTFALKNLQSLVTLWPFLTVFENHSNVSFEILIFPPIFVQLKVTCLVTLFDCKCWMRLFFVIFNHHASCFSFQF